MPRFSKSSKEKLDSCDVQLQKVFEEVIKKYDCVVLEGHRSVSRQNELYRQGRSKVRGGKSKHNAKPSLAVDVAPYPVDWNDMNRFYHFAGYVKGVADKLGVELRCGADWDGDNDFKDQTFHDMPHFEIRKKA
jgi:peptidoglycan L-alanyl-D-glutamate endopeptidase CwlK